MNSVSGIFRLVKNENMKQLFRIKTLIFCIILTIAVGVAGYFSNKNVASNNDWKASAKTELTTLNKTIKDNQQKMTKAKTDDDKARYAHTIKDAQEQAQIVDYSLKNDIPHNVPTPWEFVNTFLGLAILVEFFVLAQASQSIILEHRNGTMKQLLIRPFKRWKILLSKFLSLTISTVLLFAFLLVVLFLVGSILFGKNGMGGIELIIQNGKIVEHSVINMCLIQTGSVFIQIMIIGTIAFMMSTILKTNTLGLSVSLGILMGGEMVIPFIAKYSWAKYVLFPNMDLTQYLPGHQPIIQGNTLTFSSIVLAVYFITFVAISFVAFNKKDV